MRAPSGTTAKEGERVKLSLVAAFVDGKLLLVASKSTAAHAPAGLQCAKLCDILVCQFSTLYSYGRHSVCGWICTSYIGSRYLRMRESIECNDLIVFSRMIFAC